MSVSTTAPLSGNITYTSPTQNVQATDNRLAGSVFADQIGTVFIEQSSNGSSWDVSTPYSITASNGVGFSETIVAPFWRIRYVNGSSAQGTFRLYAKGRV